MAGPFHKSDDLARSVLSSKGKTISVAECPMVDQILSQEELEALLTAMNSRAAEVEAPKANSKAEIKSYDLTSQSLMRSEGEKNPDHAFRAQLSILLRDTPVSMAVELGRSLYSIGQLLALKRNHIVKLNAGPQDPAVVKIEGVPKYLGMPRIVNGNRAVEITALIEKGKGE